MQSSSQTVLFIPILMFQATWPQVHITHLSHSFFRFTGFPDDSPVVSPPERFERINDKGKHPFIHLPGVLKPGRSSYLFLSFFELSRTFYLYSYFKSIVCNNSQVPGFFWVFLRLRSSKVWAPFFWWSSHSGLRSSVPTRAPNLRQSPSHLCQRRPPSQLPGILLSCLRLWPAEAESQCCE